MPLLRPAQYSILCTGVKAGQGDSYSDKGMEFDPNVLFEKTAMQLRSQRPLQVKEDAGHPR
jgi:hypothetical protein